MIGMIAVIVGAALSMGREDAGVAMLAAPQSVQVGRDTIVTGPIPAEISDLLGEGRSWRAARALRSYLNGLVDPPPETVLLAARAEAQWGGWGAARGYLEGQPWLDRVADGEGWYWLARARDEEDSLSEALQAYDRFLSLSDDDGSDQRAVAELRRGLVLLRMGERASGAAALNVVRGNAPYIADWMSVLSAEALAQSGDTTAVRALIGELPPDAGMRQRGRLALVEAYETVGDLAGAVSAAIALRSDAQAAGERAALSAAAGRIALENDQAEVARRELWAAIEAAPSAAAAREAAMRMSGLPDLSTAERLAIARIFERHGNARRAADGFRDVLAAGTTSGAERDELRLALGRALFNAGDNSGARAALVPLLEADAAFAREALLLTGRAEYRAGDHQQAFRVFRRLAERFPGSVEGSEGLFLVADLAHDARQLNDAAATYRAVATNFAGTDRAGLALMRLAGIRFLDGDLPGASALWEEYRSSYPDGQRWLQATYWAGRTHQELGDAARGAERLGAVREREPLSYYALRAADRLGLPYWPVPMSEAPPVVPEAEARVADWMRGVDLLREAGLHGEADAEAQRLSTRAAGDTALLYSLAEALNERGYAIHGIRLGQQLDASSTGMNPRLLRILYPLPYRDLLEAEARERGLDPFVVAALTRQESLFTARISSPAGARGLMQIMPETGSALARGAGISEWDTELLYQPEINVHFGTTYLAEQMRRHDGSLPAVFSAYNAGPARIAVWREFPEYGDEELFTERIPYRETRDYVKILTRNIAVYRGLYGG
ncbi:MAG: transglycosylase SLT domain-containing protein [Gemmatimonadota bacterium]